MNYFDKENRIIDWLQNTQLSYAIQPDDAFTKQILMSIYDKEMWNDWIDSSGKADTPPDFYNDKMGLMMEIMRIDDHAKVGDNGQIINPVNMRESELQRKYSQIFPNATIVVNAVTELSGSEDHNYGFYINNFKRVVNNHIKQIPQYRKNHPGYKLIFYVFDESSAYMEVQDKTLVQKGIRGGQAVMGTKHSFFLDRNMMGCLCNSNVDYLLWHAPFKRYFFTNERNQLPQAILLNLQFLKSSDLVDYRVEHMLSMEE